MLSLGIIGTIASVVVGGVVAAVTIVGVVSGTVNSSADHPVNVSTTTIPYGTTAK